MREEFREEIQDDEVAWFINDGITKAVADDPARLDRIERHVMRTLEERQVEVTSPAPAAQQVRERKGLFDWLKLPSLRPALSVGLAAAGFVLGLLIYPLMFGSSLQGEGVVFVMAHPDAERVELMGDFTRWSPVKFQEVSDGIWKLEMDLAPGRHEYVFIVDGERFLVDPLADEYVNKFDDHHVNSVRYVDNS